jgi:uncharacterized membrane-anchored protein
MNATRHRVFKARAVPAVLGAVIGLLPLVAAGEAKAQEQKKGAPPAIQWQDGPTTANLGNLAQIQVPKGYQFTDAAGTRKLMELMGNPVDDKELGLLKPGPDADDPAGGSWFIVFDFNPIGYVKDEDGNNMNDKTSAAILDSIRTGNEAANAERQKRGWAVLNVVGWERPPFYDPATHNLVWAIRGSSVEGGKTNFSVNYNMRILARKGVLSANLVVDPEDLSAVVPTYDKLVKGVSFKQGESYGEMRAGDKIAEYGLIGLITGGVGAVALKTGFFTKFLKPILVGIVVAFGAVVKGIKSFFGRLTGSSGRETA